MGYDKAPVPADTAQWPEARSFMRLYSKNPEYQARFVMALLGFRQDLLEWAHDEATVEAIDTVLQTFYERHPEFMDDDGYVTESDLGGETYHMDDRLRTYMSGIIEVPPQST